MLHPPVDAPCVLRGISLIQTSETFSTRVTRHSSRTAGRRLPGVCSTGEQEEPTTPATSRRWSRRNFNPDGEITGSHWGVACLKPPFSCGITCWTHMQIASLKVTTDCSCWKLKKWMNMNDVKVLQPAWKYILYQLMSLWSNSECKAEKASGNLIHDAYQFFLQEGMYSHHVWRIYRALKLEIWGSRDSSILVATKSGRGRVVSVNGILMIQFSCRLTLDVCFEIPSNCCCSRLWTYNWQTKVMRKFESLSQAITTIQRPGTSLM